MIENLAIWEPNKNAKDTISINFNLFLFLELEKMKSKLNQD